MAVKIPKAGKYPAVPTSCQPIALTSCICITVESMTNSGVVHHLAQNKVIPGAQWGFYNYFYRADHVI